MIALNAPQFFVDVDVTDLGSAGSLTISDNQGSANVSASATGTYQFGPYANNTDVQINVLQVMMMLIVLQTVASITQEFCAITSCRLLQQVQYQLHIAMEIMTVHNLNM